jgi:predicted urease superfamily metal-dependent hydrolase
MCWLVGALQLHTKLGRSGKRELRKCLHKIGLLEPGVVAHAFNPSTREAEAGGFLSSRPAWSTE